MKQYVLMSKEFGTLYLGIKINYHMPRIEGNSYQLNYLNGYQIKIESGAHDAWIMKLEGYKEELWIHITERAKKKYYLELGEL